MSEVTFFHGGPDLECPVASTVEVVGDAWTFLILRDVFNRVRRFDEFVNSLGTARNTLTDRLEKLIETGSLTAEPYQERPLRNEYRLTEKGKDFFDVLMALWTFGEKWNPPPDPHRPGVVHVDCGEHADAVAHCAQCGGRLTRRNVRWRTAEPPASPTAGD